MATTVQHDPSSGTFSYGEGKQRAVLEYTRTDTRMMVITHTFVPPAYRGQGIAAKLAATAFAYATDEALRVVPQCQYIQTYAARHPEVQARLTQDPDNS